MSEPSQRAPSLRSNEVTLTIDRATGRVLTAETPSPPTEVQAALEEALGPARRLACAAPTRTRTLPPATPDEQASQPCVRIAGYWHDSLIEGPGRRSVAKLQGCPIRCAGCLTPDSWDPGLGSLVPTGRLAGALLDARFGRDGVSLLGGEPFAQPAGLLALVRALRARGCRDLLVYTGYTYERLRRMAERRPAIGAVLDQIDVLIDGPYVEALARSGGPWTGSGNQRVLDLGASRRCGRLVPQDPAMHASDGEHGSPSGA